MKLLLLHGPGINSSRLKLISLKKGFDPLDVVVYEEGSDISQALGSIVTLPLLSNERLIVLENPPEDFTDYPLYLFEPEPQSRRPNPYTLIFWFNHEVSGKKPIMEYVKKHGQILFFPAAKEISVFPFLDYLAAHEKIAFIEMDKLKKAGYDIQYLITMIFYLLRNLVATPKNAPDFVKKKLIKQRAKFELEGIKNLYENILEIDFKIKFGLMEKDQAEFLLVTKFMEKDVLGSF